MNPRSDSAAPFGRHLKIWRSQRGLSQLELAHRTEISQRHISFIETGRSRPKAQVIHRIAEALEIPLRERNLLLQSAGLPPVFEEKPLSDDALGPFRRAIDHILEGHEPYPAFVINRWWEVVDANQAGRRFSPLDGEASVTTIDLFLAPGPWRDSMENFAEVAWVFLQRMQREVAEAGQDDRLEALLQKAQEYLKDVPKPLDNDCSELVLCPRFRIGDQVLSTISMMSRFGSAREITLDELRVELLFPGDAAAEAFFHQVAEAQ